MAGNWSDLTGGIFSIEVFSPRARFALPLQMLVAASSFRDSKVQLSYSNPRVSRSATNPITADPDAKPWSGQATYGATLGRGPTQSAFYRGNGHWLSHYPRLVAEWHPTKNGPLRPHEVTYSAARRIWWKCPHGPDHEWHTRPGVRTVDNRGCPFCSHQVLSVTNSLVTVAPRVAAQWHPAKNGRLTPERVIAGSAQKVWWVCPVGSDHVWRAQVCKRVYQGSGCPACEGLRPSKTNSLATTNPELVAEWHSKLNDKLSPKTVVAGSTRRVWWKCPKGDEHVWQTEVRARAKLGNGCPMCANRVAVRGTRLSDKSPELAKQWHPTKNGGLSADDVVLGSKRKVWWRCEEGHEWKCEVAARAKGSSCPECSPRKLNAQTSLAAMRPDLAAQWHPAKNGILTPSDVHHGGRNRVWWKCPAGPDHEWQSAVFGRARGDGLCPFCVGIRLSVTNSLATRQPRLALEWDCAANAPLTPSEVTAGTKLRVAWRCSAEPSHRWTAPVSERNRGAGNCPHCRRNGRPPRN